MDVYFYIGLWMDFKRSVALIGCCKELWGKKLYFWRQKHLMVHNKVLMDFWQPEQQFYASLQDFVLFTRDITMYMEVSLLYQNCNAIDNMVNNEDECFLYDNVFKFKIEQPWMVIWLNYGESRYAHRVDQWSYTFFHSLEDIQDHINNMDVNNNWSIKYTVVDLSKTVPCWAKYKSKGFIHCWTEYVPKSKGISGE